jgi:threonine dehydrogenase-like Zn-dependent dehydrogenase
MRRLMAMVDHKRVDLTPLVTHHFGLDEIETALDLFAHQRDGVMKVALHPAMRMTEGERKLAGIAAQV